MQELKKVWAFGLPYLRPYRFRFAAGVALATMRLLGERPFRMAFGPCGATDAFIKPCTTVAVGRPA
jgi:hypothetical protein